MDKKFGYPVVVCLAIGAIFGAGMGSANGNPMAGIGIGALAGVFLGWFIAAAILQRQSEKKEDK